MMGVGLGRVGSRLETKGGLYLSSVVRSYKLPRYLKAASGFPEPEPKAESSTQDVVRGNHVCFFHGSFVYVFTSPLRGWDRMFCACLDSCLRCVVLRCGPGAVMWCLLTRSILLVRPLCTFTVHLDRILWGRVRGHASRERESMRSVEEGDGYMNPWPSIRDLDFVCETHIHPDGSAPRVYPI